jgi:transposase
MTTVPVVFKFAASLQQDYQAVRTALRYRWSGGPTEGHINRLKCPKREM